MTQFDSVLLDTGAAIKKKYTSLISNMGRAVALITLIVAALVTFTDIGFGDLRGEAFTSNLLLMLIASYVIYFSLENAGERLGQESEEYTAAAKKQKELCRLVTGDMIGSLRSFIENYALEELEYRKKMRLYSIGSSEDELKAFLSGESVPRARRRKLKKIAALRPVRISAQSILSLSGRFNECELSDPGSGRLLRLIVSLLPSTVCMCVTVSVMLSVKSNLDAAAVISGIMKLVSLIIIGVRGYSIGYFYSKEGLVGWLEAKHRLLDAFLKKEGKISDKAE